MELAVDQLERGEEIGWEWPDRHEAWFYPEVHKLFQEVGHKGRLRMVRLDGCMVGVEAPDTGNPMLKPWKTKTAHEGTDTVLDLRCDGIH